MYTFAVQGVGWLIDHKTSTTTESISSLDNFRDPSGFGLGNTCPMPFLGYSTAHNSAKNIDGMDL